MELTTVHVYKNNLVMIHCPFCGMKQRVAADGFKDVKHKIKVRCKCKSRFEVQFNFRKSYRKSVSLAGEFRTLPPKPPTDRMMNIYDLSRNGLRFKMIDTVVVNIGDELLVKFNLDDRKRTLIHKKVAVRYASNDFLGCEFTELDLYEKELGFYLLA